MSNMSREDDIRRVVQSVLDTMPDADALLGASKETSDTGPVSASTGNGAHGDVTVAFGADHGGFALKEMLLAFVRDTLGFGVRDCGTHSTDAVDYPVLAHKVARQVATGGCQWGIIVDGAGIGSAMAANKVPGVRAALCYDLSSARNSREHNLANVLTLGAGLIGPGLAKQIVQTWLETPWGGDRHARRVALITDVEQRYLRRNT